MARLYCRRRSSGCVSLQSGGGEGAVLAVFSPWPTVTAVLWVLIGAFGLWLGLLGIAMATGLAMVLRANPEIPEEYWRSIVDYRPAPK